VSSLADRLDDFDLAVNDVDKDASDDDEYEAYLAQSNTQTTESALNWWLLNAQRQTWPRLSQMAIDLLSIPAMSDEPERVFSGARRTISWERTKLGSSNIEKTECLKHWMRGDLVSTE
jgi:hAT family C-terminal dimerisation region